MLTNLDFLNVGEQWPPLCEYDRLQMYEHNRALFENEHAAVYFEAFKRIERVISNFQEVVSYPVIVNYQKLISLKVADLLVGEPFKVTAGEYGSKEQLAVDTILKRSDLQNKAYVAALDVSRFGDGLLRIFKDDMTNSGMISTAQPALWFPVVDPNDLTIFQYQVQAWEFKRGEAKYLKVRIHEKGFRTEHEYLLEGSQELAAYIIKTQTVTGNREATGLDDFAILPISNVLTSDRVHGMDDYSDIDSIISELLVRLAQIARVLDKHASPSISGPQSALDRDLITGEWKLKSGTYYPRDTGLDGRPEVEVKYITWDGNLEASFKMIEQLINLLHAISETGGQLLGDTNQEGGALSGTALRFKMISPLAKVKRIAMRFKPALEKAIVLCSQLGGKDIVPLTDVPISITFMDGLPNDPKEESEIMMNRTGSKATMSIQRALQVYDGMTPDDADNELAQIQEEEQAANPMMQPITVDPNANGGNNNASNSNKNSGN